jgi:hypothetical protein
MYEASASQVAAEQRLNFSHCATYTPLPAKPTNRRLPMTAKLRASTRAKPVLTDVHLWPRLVETKMPPCVPANTLVPVTSSEMTRIFDKPVLTCIQLWPLSVERKTPPYVAANRLAPLTVKALMSVTGPNPVLTCVQLCPLSVERKTPLPKVPTKSVVPVEVIVLTRRFAIPTLAGVQV